MTPKNVPSSILGEARPIRSCLSLQVIVSRGGRFLEAPVSGNQQLSNDGMLVILAAGDRGLYEDCSSCFQAMGKTSFFLGNIPTYTYLAMLGLKACRWGRYIGDSVSPTWPHQAS